MSQVFASNFQLLRLATPLPLYNRRSERKCRACGHWSEKHVGFADPALAEQLSRIHSGCLDCEVCADE